MLKHYVYLVKFENRIKRKEEPYYYIGSKSNSTFINNKLYDSKGNEYIGSSRYPGYKDLFYKENAKIEIISEVFNIDDLLKIEKEEQLKVKAKTNSLYFNMEYANEYNNYSKSGYGTYKHHKTGKVVRLKVDDPLVLSNEYVGVTKGTTLSIETKNKISKSTRGPNNGFYGKQHTEKAKNKISKANKNKTRTDKVKENISKRFKGVPKTDEHKAKIGRKGLVNLKHPETLHSIRVSKDEESKYKKLGYLNPYAVKMLNSTEVYECIHCKTKTKSVSNLKRWHMDNCKYRGKNEIS